MSIFNAEERQSALECRWQHQKEHGPPEAHERGIPK